MEAWLGAPCLRRGAVLNRSRPLAWLQELREQIPDLRMESAPRPYWSQKQRKSSPAAATDLVTTITRCRTVVAELTREHWFSRSVGFECYDGHGDSSTTMADVLENRVGKPHLIDLPTERWTEDDLCDFVEVLHDISARPSRGWFHEFSGCGWHPTDYDRSSGQAIYRWRVNQVLDASTLGLRLAAEGEDIGRIVRVLPTGLDELVVELAEVGATGDATVPHAIMLFRRNGATREDRRAAVRALADVFEENRKLLKDELLSKDEGALFQIANQFGIRHRNADQKSNYPDEYLDWLFHWYLATVDLIRRIVDR